MDVQGVEVAGNVQHFLSDRHGSSLLDLEEQPCKHNRGADEAAEVLRSGRLSQGRRPTLER
eukprot:10167801-Prorocentrum_lima.AAC.1